MEMPKCFTAPENIHESSIHLVVYLVSLIPSLVLSGFSQVMELNEDSGKFRENSAEV